MLVGVGCAGLVVSTVLQLLISTPSPVSVADCGEPTALSTTEMVAATFAMEVGINVTEMGQLAPPASVPPQVLVSAKLVALVPPMLMLVMLTAVLPVLESVSVWAAEVVPTGVVGKVRFPAESETTVPVPANMAVCGELAALSATEIEAVKLAAEAGVNVTAIVQVVAVASALGQLVVSAKSDGLVPVMLMLVMFSVVVPVLESVKTWAVAVEPTAVFAKVRLEAESDATGSTGGGGVLEDEELLLQPIIKRARGTSAAEAVEICRRRVTF